MPVPGASSVAPPPGAPTREQTDQTTAGATEAAVARLGIGVVEGVEIIGARRVRIESDHVVYGAGVVRSHMHARHIACRRLGPLHDEAAVVVVFGIVRCVIDGHLQGHVDAGQRRQLGDLDQRLVGGITHRCALVDPCGDRVDVGLAERTIELVIVAVAVGMPRRHQPIGDLLFDERRPRLDAVEIDQAANTDLAVLMAAGAVGIDDRLDVAVIRECRLGLRRRRRRVALLGLDVVTTTAGEQRARQQHRHDSCHDSAMVHAACRLVDGSSARTLCVDCFSCPDSVRRGAYTSCGR